MGKERAVPMGRALAPLGPSQKQKQTRRRRGLWSMSQGLLGEGPVG
jgi:hypothetical protein